MQIKGLQRRFILMMLAMAVVLAVAAAALAYRLGLERAYTHGRTTLEGLISAVEKTAAIGAYTKDDILMKEVVDGLARNPLAETVTIRSLDGKIHIVSAGGNHVNARDILLFVERRLVSPFDAAEAVATIRIDADMNELGRQAKAEALTLAALTAGQTVAVACLIFFFAERFVSRPIVRVANELRGMQPASGVRLQIPRSHENDEIGTLIEGANALLDGSERALQTERALRAEIEKMEAQYRKIFDSSGAGIFVLGSDGRLVNCNPTALSIAGFEAVDVQRFKGLDLVQEAFAEPDAVRKMIAQAIHARGTVAADLRLRTRDASQRWVHCLISAQSRSAGNGGSLPTSEHLIEGVIYDITERKRSESAVQHQAEHDPLTGLKNRQGAETALERLLAESVPFSLLYLDLDGFKTVNDTLGHLAGDQVLKECANRMRQAIRRSDDLIGRLGGDEFLIVLNNVGPSDQRLTEVAQALVDLLHQPLVLENAQIVQVGASVGIACRPTHGHTRSELMAAADAAMYQAKRAGKSQFVIAN